MRQQENSLQTACNRKIQQCIFAVMFGLDEVRKGVLLLAVIFIANIILFLLASSSFSNSILLCLHTQFSLVKRSFWILLLLPAVSLAFLVALFSEISCRSVLPHTTEATNKLLSSFLLLLLLLQTLVLFIKRLGQL